MWILMLLRWVLCTGIYLAETKTKYFVVTLFTNYFIKLTLNIKPIKYRVANVVHYSLSKARFFLISCMSF